MNTTSFRNHFVKFLPNAVTILIVAMMLFAFRAYAMPGSTIPADDSIGWVSYQGQLMDAGGKPVDGKVDITFSLYEVNENGEPLWTEVHTGENAVPVESGLFHVFLGSLESIPSSVWNTELVYLGIQVAGDPEMTPRQEIGRVAYALAADYATTAERAYGLAAENGPRDVVVTTEDGNLKIPFGGICITPNNEECDPGPGGLVVGSSSPPASKLQVNGDIEATGDIAWLGHLGNINWSGYEIYGGNGQKSKKIRSSDNSVCFLDWVQFRKPGDWTECKVYPEGDNWWHLSYRADGKDAYAYCYVTCLSW